MSRKGPFLPHPDRCPDCVRHGWRRGFGTGIACGVLGVAALLGVLIAVVISNMGC